MKRFLLGILTALAQAAVVALAGYWGLEWLMQGIVHARQEVEVPEIKGRTLREALEAVSKARLAITLEAQEFAPEKPAGTVLKQHPLAGSRVREGKIVRVVTSLGSEKVTVPDLLGLALRKAEIEIRAARLVLGETSEAYSLAQPRGHVLAQEPKPLALAEVGELINLTLSQGEPPQSKLIIPGFVGRSEAEAQAWAKAQGIALQITEDPDSQAADGAILKQSLSPDAVLDRETIDPNQPLLELSVARNARGTGRRTFAYAVPRRPQRRRELVVKMVAARGERVIHRTSANAGENVNIAVPGNDARARIRIYLDGVFAEERILE